jgi:hypothetical protein
MAWGITILVICAILAFEDLQTACSSDRGFLGQKELD